LEIRKNTKFLFILSIIWAFLILALGWWWIYLILSMKEKLAFFSNDTSYPKFLKMIQWEGGTFFICLLLLSGTLLALYLRDLKKTKTMQAFLSSLTHELKTPLASVRLQADVIRDLVTSNASVDNLKSLTGRLIEDTQNLETQMDKVLQLSRVEQDGSLALFEFNLFDIIKTTQKKWAKDLNITIEATSNDFLCICDEFAMELILRNIFENTKVHAVSNSSKITLTQTAKAVELLYQDYGEFKGNTQRLGELFYKHNSQRGSGIGLYLSKKLVKKMNGLFKIKTNPHFSISITLLKGLTKNA